MTGPFQVRWWSLVLRGVLAMAFGLTAFAKPLLAGVAVAFLFGIYAVFDGIVALWAASSGRSPHRWLSGVLGVISLLAAWVAFTQPLTALFAFVVVIGVWAVLRGVIEIAAGIALRKEIVGEWLLIGAGVLSVVFGVLVLATPVGGMLAVLWIIGTYAFVLGALLVLLGLRLRSLSSAAAG